MSQILFQWGPIVIPAYGLLLGIAYAMAMGLAESRGVRLGMPRFLVLDAVFAAFAGAVFGAGAFHFMFSGGSGFSAHGGRSFFAGALGGTFAGIAVAKLKGGSALLVADVSFLYVPLCQAVGRVGCWFYGCCHGATCPAGAWYGVRFPRLEDVPGHVAGSPAFREHLESGLIPAGAQWSLPVYPTQLLAVVLCLCVFVALRLCADRAWARAKPGSIAALYLILGGAVRFGEEFLRDHHRYFGLLTNAQVVSLAMTAGGGIWLWRMHRFGWDQLRNSFGAAGA